jgi:hypothetical protein
MGYIYKITNIQNNKMYVGQTNNPEATKQLISQKNSGRKYSEEELERCRIRNKGEHNPFFGKKQLLDINGNM